MKPKVFIGSSTESLEVAYAIQSNLDKNSEITIWTQGIFKLSNTVLEDLLNVLGDYDFGIFIFSPDDIIELKSEMFKTVRDNVIFELGLFLGKLGKQRVFIVKPQDEDNLHLPTDLLGLTIGSYNPNRTDRNITAALGVFCNQVRNQIKDVLITDLSELDGETKLVKAIAFEKKICWEMQLCSELLKSRMSIIKQERDNVVDDYLFEKSVRYTTATLVEWTIDAFNDLVRCVDIGKRLYEIEMTRCLCPQEGIGDVSKIRNVVTKINDLCNYLLAWKKNLRAIKPPEAYTDIPKLMRGWGISVVDEFIKLPGLLAERCRAENVDPNVPVEITLLFPEPANHQRVTELLNLATEEMIKGEIPTDCNQNNS